MNEDQWLIVNNETTGQGLREGLTDVPQHLRQFRDGLDLVVE